MLRSIRESMAGSRSCFLLVAQISNTSVVLSKLSILRSKVERTRLLASCISELLLPARASISSMKMMTRPRLRQAYQISPSCFSL